MEANHAGDADGGFSVTKVGDAAYDEGEADADGLLL